MSATIAAAVDETAALFVTDGRVLDALRDAGVRKVYDHEPAAVEKGCSLTVCYAGQEPTDYLIAVRLYVADVAPRDAQRLLWGAIEAVDEVLGDGQFAGPSTWEPPVFDVEEGVHIAQTLQRVPRDTF